MSILQVLRKPLLATLAVFAVSALVLDREMGFVANMAPEVLRLGVMIWAGWLVVRHRMGGLWQAATAALLIVMVDPLLLRGGMLYLTTPGGLDDQGVAAFVMLVVFTAPIAMLFGAFGGLLADVQAEARARRGEPHPDDLFGDGGDVDEAGIT